MNEKILIVEDDKNISELIKYNLEKAGFTTISAISGESALDILQTQTINLILLDIMLPEIDGFEICRRIKQDHKLANIPIIILTAKSEEIDKIVGFELGVDDYVIKPFSPRELSLRIKAVLKRKLHIQNEEEILNVSNIIIDIPKHTVTVNKKEIDLTAMEFKLLSLLIQRKNRVQTRESLLNDVWDITSEVTTRTIDTHIKRIRQKLGKAGDIIETIRGVGYVVRD